MKLKARGELQLPIEWFGDIDPVRQITQCAYFESHFSNSILQPLKQNQSMYD